MYGANIMTKRGEIADFFRADSPADPVGILSMTEITPYFVKTLTKPGQSLDC